MIEQTIGMMPLKKNVSNPPDDWELRRCPVCNQECYYQRKNATELKRITPNAVFACTECALKGQVVMGGSKDE